MTMDVRFSRRAALGMLLATAGFTAACGRVGSAALAQGGPASAATLAAPSVARSALIHDAIMLLVSDADLTGEWQDALLPLPIDKPFEFSYAYGVASLGADVSLARDIANEIRAGWADRGEPFMDIQRHKGQMIERRLGIAVGWAANRAGAKVLFDGVSEAAGVAGLDGVFLRALMGSGVVSQGAARRTFRVLYERAFMAMHTLEPDLDGWGGLDITAMHDVKSPDQHAYSPGHWASVSNSSRYGKALAAAHGGARLMLDVAGGAKDVSALDALAV